MSSSFRINIKGQISRQDKKSAIVIIISFFIVLIMILFSNHYSIFFTKFRLTGFEVGKAAPRDLIADHNYNFIDTTASDIKVENGFASILPVFEMDNETIKSVISEFSIFSRKYLQYKETQSDELKNEIKTYFIYPISLEEIDFLLEDVDPFVVIPGSSDIIEDILSVGIFDFNELELLKEEAEIHLWQWERGSKKFNIVKTENIHTRKNIGTLIDLKLSQKDIPDKEKNAVKLIVDQFIKANVFFNETQTQIKYDDIRNNIKPEYMEIQTGDYIIRRGSTVSAKDIEKAIIMISENKKINFLQIIADFLYLILIFTFALLMFKPLFKDLKRKYQYLYLLISFYTVFILYTSVIIQFNFTTGYILSLFLPTALFSMMIVILIGFQESILSVFILSLSLFLFHEVNITDFIFSFVSGIAAAFLMKGVKKRIDLIKTAVFLSLINILVLLIGFSANISLTWLMFVILFAALNAFLSGILNLTLIPVFEHFLNIPTIFRLMELSDMNAPLFRKMVTMAPGTYGHSMAVANLADAASRDIGANPLLARVGAYYHDIGKLDQAEYFIENQTEANKHDMLNPSLSVAVIKSHVKVGVERAKELGLPFEVIEIISQHHGSGLIGYFYIEAINKEASKNKIQPKDYSYTGIPPESKEAAIVMLADTIEAASRVLKKPTIIKLEKFIWKLIMEKIERGQMANTSLTMNDMLIIKKSFVNILSGYFHTRIEYPKIKKK
jgi:cyclic-di-AMP phosphodiesterase PgpH